jgi:acyl-CoA synthetase (AMP-forming)/AMP-acid ligase II
MGSFDSLVARIESNAARHGDRVAIVDRGRAIGYAALWDDILRAEAWARRQGIRSGNWVALTVDDQHLNAVLSLALLRMGCSQTCLPSFERAETNQRLADRLPLDWQLVSPPLPPIRSRCPSARSPISRRSPARPKGRTRPRPKRSSS